MLNRNSFAVLRAIVWTAAFVKSLPSVPASTEAELVASFRAWRTLECWLMAWGPTFAPESWEADLAKLHETLPVDQQIFPKKAPAPTSKGRGT